MVLLNLRSARNLPSPNLIPDLAPSSRAWAQNLLSSPQGTFVTPGIEASATAAEFDSFLATI